MGISPNVELGQPEALLSWSAGLDEVSGKEQPAPFDRLESKAGCRGKATDCGSRLVMRVADHLGNTKPSTQFESFVAPGERCGTIGDFAEDGAEKYEVEACLDEMRQRRVSENDAQVFDPRAIGANSQSLNHRRLDVDPDRFSVRQDSFRSGNQQPPGSRPDLQDLHPGLKLEPIEGDSSAVESLDEWVLEKPGQ
jgi:hypothetical protein